MASFCIIGRQCVSKNENNWAQTSFSINFGGKLSFILTFLFLSASTAATCIFTAPICTTTIIKLELVH
jgi:NADH:ubiquinone oxidoreductase subunit 5 (subunit L)/multisubunit Na+/H+ antiporter MnhA subunit